MYPAETIVLGSGLMYILLAILILVVIFYLIRRI